MAEADPYAHYAVGVMSIATCQPGRAMQSAALKLWSHKVLRWWVPAALAALPEVLATADVDRAFSQRPR